MKLKFTGIERVSTTDEPLKTMVTDLSFEAGKPGGSIQRLPSNNHEHHFKIEDDTLIPIAELLQFHLHPQIEVSQVPVFIYGTLDLLAKQVPEGIHASQIIEEGEDPIQMTFDTWGIEGNQTNPIAENDTHCILRTAVNGNHMTSEEIGIMHQFCLAEGYELLGKQEYFDKVNAEFNKEEI